MLEPFCGEREIRAAGIVIVFEPGAGGERDIDPLARLLIENGGGIGFGRIAAEQRCAVIFVVVAGDHEIDAQRVHHRLKRIAKADHRRIVPMDAVAAQTVVDKQNRPVMLRRALCDGGHKIRMVRKIPVADLHADEQHARAHKPVIAGTSVLPGHRQPPPHGVQRIMVAGNGGEQKAPQHRHTLEKHIERVLRIVENVARVDDHVDRLVRGSALFERALERRFQDRRMVFVRSRGIEVCVRNRDGAQPAGLVRAEMVYGVRRPAGRHDRIGIPRSRRNGELRRILHRVGGKAVNVELRSLGGRGGGLGRQRAVRFGGAVENAHALGMPRSGPAYAHRRVVLPGKKIGRGERDCRFRRRHRLGGRLGRRLRGGRERGGGRRFYRRRFGCGRLRHGGGTARKKQHSEEKREKTAFHFHSSLVSSRMVTGPLLTDSTSISAPNSPVSTWNPLSRQSATTRS